ncbi:hypothetical protein ACEPAG_3904 [Sanghuangporus baumii]
MENRYTLQPAYVSQTELQRLDRVHIAFTEYFGGRLALAPLDTMKPRAILDMGCGSGAWSIDAALRFPEATVHAVDISPVPSRSLPSNMQFQLLNLRDPFPFEEASFDIIHIRMLPDVEQFLHRVAALIKPSGWLLIEEPDDDDSSQDGTRRGIAAQSPLVAKLHSIIRSHGSEPCIGKDLQRILASSGQFSEVNVEKVTIPMCGQPVTSAAMQKFSLVWRDSHLDIANSLPALYSAQGLTEDMAKQFREDLEDVTRKFTACIYLTWSMRKTD